MPLARVRGYGVGFIEGDLPPFVAPLGPKTINIHSLKRKEKLTKEQKEFFKELDEC